MFGVCVGHQRARCDMASWENLNIRYIVLKIHQLSQHLMFIVGLDLKSGVGDNLERSDIIGVRRY